MNVLREVLNKGHFRIVDVRTPAEFMGGHVAGSTNIPLNELVDRLDELKGGKHIIVCCASGGRSAQAALWLTTNGVTCTDGGPWTNVNNQLNF